MAGAADIGGKRLIGLAPDAWARWVTGRPDVTTGAVITPRFQWMSRENDVLMRAHDPQEGEFLLAIEVQLRYDRRMARRIHAYAALAEEHHDLPVYPVVVNIIPPPADTIVPDRYEATFMGLAALREYRVLNLWEVDAERAFQPPTSALLPFVPMLRGGDNEGMVRRALAALRADER